ncbi:MAG: mechanosensitive ion channel family protein [Prevotella sp.]|nr:mechanosensitive ion channel family protein [Prevotella sp.]MCH3992331.1 mechanosensitive ion channel family protein [Prevotella sp.]MCH4017083.1 mechanosensitive ion channel family protein [Prevotella sp.]MCH4099996.1 mechanosensitive ion channel family protein [Prevotella sp.]MCH4185629.1 mechanosensitive ion channel family protein [Prevotella sp.]
MERIRIFVEQMISLTGIHGPAVPVLRHVLLILVTAFLAWLFYVICRKTLVPLIMSITRKTTAKWDSVLFNERVLVSACRIVPAIVVWKLLPMVFYQFPSIRVILTRLTAIYIVVMTTRTAVVFIDSFNQLEIISRRSSTRQYLKSFCGVLKILMVFIAFVVIIAILLNKSPMALFAGLGATSAVLMLVFKDTIEGLVSGVRLTSNDMIHVGDWITVPDTTVDGVVKEMSLSTVKVQNFDNTIVTISPQALINGSFQNWIGMEQSPGRRIKRAVYFDFRSIKFVDDEKKVTNMGLFRRAMEEFLMRRDDVNSEMMVMVRELEATQCGVPVEFYFFLKIKDWKLYEEHLADIMDYVYSIARDYGLTIYQQFPMQ